MRHAGRHIALKLSEKAQMLGSTQTKLQNVVYRDVIAGVVSVSESTKVGQAK